MPIAPPPDSPETKGKPEVISFTNQIYEHTDSGEIEPDLHCRDADLHGDQEEPNCVGVPDNNTSDSLGGGAVQDEKGLESSGGNVDQPEDNLEQLGGDSSRIKPEYSNIGGGMAGALGGYGGDDDEDHLRYY